MKPVVTERNRRQAVVYRVARHIRSRPIAAFVGIETISAVRGTDLAADPAVLEPAGPSGYRFESVRLFAAAVSCDVRLNQLDHVSSPLNYPLPRGAAGPAHRPMRHFDVIVPE